MEQIRQKGNGTEQIVLPDYIRALTARLEAAGERVYLVGGSLRDILLGQTPHDYDLATSATPQKTLSLFREDFRVIETGLKHGTVTVLSEGNPVEITTFRVDGDYTDGRHPDAVSFTRRIADDLSRRDFTVNAMAYREGEGLIDLFDGKADLRRRIIRTVGESRRRFSEDALRILRAFRFSAQLEFTIDEGTAEGIAACREGLSRIAKERVASEFLRLLRARDPAPALLAMKDSGVFPFVLQDYTPCVEAIRLSSSLPPSEEARLGFLLTGTDRAADILHELKLSNKQITGALAVLRGSAKRIETAADARRLIACCGAWSPLAVRAAILRGNAPKEAVGWVENNDAPVKISELAVTGKDLLSVGLCGKEVGETLNALLAAVIKDPALNQRDILLAMAKKEGLA